MMNEPLSSIMTSELITASPSDKLSTVENILDKHRIHHVPIVDAENNLLGLVTTYDIFRHAKNHDKFNKIAVEEMMTTKLAILSPMDKIASAAELFLENLFHAVPIVADGKLVGLVTSFDVLRYSFRKEYPRRDLSYSYVSIQKRAESA